VRSGGVVLERTFAEALEAKVGEHLTLDHRSFAVVGIAVTAAQAPYPNLCYFTTNTCANYTVVGQGPKNVALLPHPWVP
jgi:putative ABC transport system permease protein